MKHLLGFILVFITTTVSLSQGTVVVYDKTQQAPIVGAKVEVYYLKDTTILITNIKGKVQISSFQDSIKISVSFLGYEHFTDYIYSSKKNSIYLIKKDIILNPVVITGQFEPNTKTNSLYDIVVVTEKEIDEKASTNLQEVLNNQLNFKTNNGHTNETAININGLSGSHVKFMIDGVPVEGRVNGNIDLSQLNTYNIKRVEIIEGPVSVVYGTNALGGIVNIITKKKDNKTNFFANSYYETIGKYNLNVGANWHKNKLNLKLSAGRNFFSGYSNNDSLRSKIWKPREQYFGTFLIGYHLKKLYFTSTFNAFSEKMISKGDLKPPYYTSAFDVYTNTQRFRNYYLLNGKLTNNIYLDLMLGYSYYNRKRNIYFKDLTTLNQFLTTGSNDQDTTIYHNFIFRGFFSHKVLHNKLTYLSGTELKQDFISSNRIENQQHSLGNYALFIALKYQPIKHLTLQPALRYDYSTIFKAPITPSFIAEFSYKSFKFKSSYAKGFRTPTLKELFLEFHYNSTINLWGNTQLTSEYSDYFMTSTSYQKNRLTISLKIFYNKIKNMIALVKISDLDWQYNNIGYYITKGITSNIKYIYKPITLSIGYTYLGTYNGQFNFNEFKNKYNYSSNLIINLTYKLKKMGLGCNLSYKYIGKTTNFFLSDEGKIENAFINEYSLFDVSLHKKFLHKKLTINCGVKNLFNTTQVNLQGKVFGYSTPKNASSISILWGRTYFIALKYKI